jgi:hypothetical protein
MRLPTNQPERGSYCPHTTAALWTRQPRISGSLLAAIEQKSGAGYSPSIPNSAPARPTRAVVAGAPGATAAAAPPRGCQRAGRSPGRTPPCAARRARVPAAARYAAGHRPRGVLQTLVARQPHHRMGEGPTGTSQADVRPHSLQRPENRARALAHQVVDQKRLHVRRRLATQQPGGNRSSPPAAVRLLTWPYRMPMYPSLGGERRADRPRLLVQGRAAGHWRCPAVPVGAASRSTERSGVRRAVGA